MKVDPKVISKINKKAWARAKKLAKLAYISPIAARNFLSQSTTEQKALLDSTDLRNKALRTLVDRAGEFGKDPTRRYLTDEVPSNHQSSCDGAFMSDAVIVRKTKKAWKIEEVLPDISCSVELLYALKELVDKHGDDTVESGLATLRWLRK
jgi:hypothetical protein